MEDTEVNLLLVKMKPGYMRLNSSITSTESMGKTKYNAFSFYFKGLLYQKHLAHYM